MGGLCWGNIRRAYQMDSWTTSKAFSHFFSFLPALLPLTHTHSVCLFPTHLQSGCSKPGMVRDAYTYTQADTLHVPAAAGKVLGDWQCSRHQKYPPPPAQTHTALIPLDQAGLGALEPSLLQSIFRHSLAGIRPCTNMLLPIGKISHGQGTEQAVPTDPPMPQF